jgi:hypothetical protein
MRSLRLKSGTEVSTVDRETLVISFADGHYYAITGVGSDLLATLANGPLSLEYVVASFMAHFEKKADEIVKFVSESAFLETGEFEGEERLVRWSLPYLEPKVTTHAELADILVLDPIHDAGPAGWPSR